MQGKDASIEALVARLNLPERGWVVVDHWEGDRCAIGIASSGVPERLVYVSTFRQRSGLFDYECESPAVDPDELYRVARSGTGVSYEELLAVMVRHFAGEHSGA